MKKVNFFDFLDYNNLNCIIIQKNEAAFFIEILIFSFFKDKKISEQALSSLKNFENYCNENLNHTQIQFIDALKKEMKYQFTYNNLWDFIITSNENFWKIAFGKRKFHIEQLSKKDFYLFILDFIYAYQTHYSVLNLPEGLSIDVEQTRLNWENYKSDVFIKI